MENRNFDFWLNVFLQTLCKKERKNESASACKCLQKSYKLLILLKNRGQYYCYGKLSHKAVFIKAFFTNSLGFRLW